MALTVKDGRFLGLNLQALWADFRSAWQGLDRSPALSWLTPAVPIRLLGSDGKEVLYLGHVRHSGKVTPKVAFEAVNLPDELVLSRRLVLPVLAVAEQADAVALEVRSVSPFPEADLVWGFRNHAERGGSVAVDIALASRRQILDYMLSRKLDAEDAEVWWFPAGVSTPVILSGFGEGRRAQYARKRRIWGYGLLGMALGLMIALAIAPVAQLRLRAIDAVNAYVALNKQAEPVVRKRENLLLSMERVASLKDLLADRVDPLYIMDLLTRLTPDDTVLQSIQVQGAKVNIAGQTSNAAALMQKLSAEVALRDVRAPAPATRPLGAAKEVFSIEFMVSSAAVRGAGSSAPSLSDAALGPASTASAPVAASTAVVTSQPASSPAVPAAPSKSSLPPAGGGVSFGGNDIGAQPTSAKP